MRIEERRRAVEELEGRIERLSDDPGWERVPPNHLLVVSAGRVARLEPLSV